MLLDFSNQVDGVDCSVTYMLLPHAIDLDPSTVHVEAVVGTKAYAVEHACWYCGIQNSTCVARCRT
jgi:hypothetical protein